MILSKSDLRDPLNRLFWVKKKIMHFTNKINLGQLTTIPKFKFLNWVLVDPIRPPTLVKIVNNNIINTFFGALPKISGWIWKYVQIHHGF